MDMTITLSDDVAAKLDARATDTGLTATAYAARLVAESVSKPTIDEILAPVRADFAQSGMSEDELFALGREAIAEVRQSRAARSA